MKSLSIIVINIIGQVDKLSKSNEILLNINDWFHISFSQFDFIVVLNSLSNIRIIVYGTLVPSESPNIKYLEIFTFAIV